MLERQSGTLVPAARIVIPATVVGMFKPQADKEWFKVKVNVVQEQSNHNLIAMIKNK